MDAVNFYDGLAQNYHLIATGWDGAVRAQGEKIAPLLEQGVKRVLDCSCGIGTQSIGLALQGLEVTGTDLSSNAIKQAVENARRLGVNANFLVADMRELKGVVGPFDAVISFDNSIAHLLTDADLLGALQAMRRQLAPAGSLLLSVRDYEQLKKDRPTGMPPRRIRDEHGDRVYAQTWEWTADGSYYDLSLFVLKNMGPTWEANPLETRMRAWTQEEIIFSLEKTGFADCEWLVPTQTGYYQPILRARAIK